METHEKILTGLTIISSTIGVVASILYLREKYKDMQAADALRAAYVQAPITPAPTSPVAPRIAGVGWQSAQIPLAPMDITETKVI